MGRKPSDLYGFRSGRLVAQEPERRRRTDGKIDVYWKCVCDCGNVAYIAAGSLKSGATESCGCITEEKHGRSTSPEYVAWRSMIDRCYSKSFIGYDNYGGRGITVCEKWRNSFDAFFADVGTRPSKGHSLDRFPNNNGNYEPGNVRWATRSQQQRNRRCNRLIEFRGKTMTITEWAIELGIPLATISTRLRIWNNDINRVFTTPVRKYKGNEKWKASLRD